MGEYNKIAKKPLISFATNGTVNLYTGKGDQALPRLWKIFCKRLHQAVKGRLV